MKQLARAAALASMSNLNASRQRASYTYRSTTLPGYVSESLHHQMTQYLERAAHAPHTSPGMRTRYAITDPMAVSFRSALLAANDSGLHPLDQIAALATGHEAAVTALRRLGVALPSAPAEALGLVFPPWLLGRY